MWHPTDHDEKGDRDIFTLELIFTVYSGSLTGIVLISK